MHHKHLWGKSIVVGEDISNNQNWELRICGTEGKYEKIVELLIGKEICTIRLNESLRCELLAAIPHSKAGIVQRYTKRENFTYCPVTNVAYIADYVSVTCIDGSIRAALYQFRTSSSYNEETKEYNTITYNETALSIEPSNLHNALGANAVISNGQDMYMELIHAVNDQICEAIEFSVTKTLTQENSGLSSIARNFIISSDGKTAYIGTNDSWHQNADDIGRGAWLLEMSGYDTDSPTVRRKVLLNDCGNCRDLVKKGVLSSHSHGTNCPGRNLQEMGRACTGIAENGNYLYAVERYTGAFDVNQRLTNLNALQDETRDDGLHGHGISYLCVIRKRDFQIEKRILLKNAATSIEINRYDGFLYVMEMTRNWSVFNIENASSPLLIHSFSENGEFGGENIDKVNAYALGNDYIEYQRATFWTNGKGKNYLAMSAFTGGVTIWDITDVRNRIPIRVAHFSIKEYNNGIYGRHVFDVAARYPYLYITVAGTVNYRFSSGNISDGVIAIDVSDPSKVGNSRSVAIAVGIPFDDEADRCNEGDPAPSRIVIMDDVLMVNYAEKGVAMFRIGEDSIPVYDRCVRITNGNPQTMKENPATGGIVIINGEGHVHIPGMYEIQIHNKKNRKVMR